MRFLTAIGGELPAVSRLINYGIGKALQAAERSDNIEGQDDTDEDAEAITNDALRATIMKSKKVLAMQRNLLQQVFFGY